MDVAMACDATVNKVVGRSQMSVWATSNCPRVGPCPNLAQQVRRAVCLQQQPHDRLVAPSRRTVQAVEPAVVPAAGVEVHSASNALQFETLSQCVIGVRPEQDLHDALMALLACRLQC